MSVSYQAVGWNRTKKIYDGILANRTALQRVLKLQMRTQQLKQQKLQQQGQ